MLRVSPFDNPHQQETVIVFQTKVFAGATMEFRGSWTVHKQFGRQFQATDAFEVVIIPVLTQHFKMLFRNLIYTGLTRAKKLAVFVGTRKALAMAVQNQDTSKRQTALQEMIEFFCKA